MEKNDDRVIPYGVALLMYKFHILSRLTREHGLSPKEAKDRLEAARLKTDDTISTILSDLVEQENPK